MKRLMTLHLYLSCLVAPSMLFFAVSGAWQAFRFHQTRKDGSYVAPGILSRLSHIHQAEQLTGSAAPVFKWGQVAIALMFAVTAIIGLEMARRIVRPAWKFWAVILTGIALPLIVVVAASQ